MCRSLLALACLGVLAPVVTACSGSGSGDDGVTRGERTPLPSTAAEALWNPCDGLDTSEVDAVFGETFGQETGSEADPRCTFTPGTEGGVVVNVTYQLYGGTIKDIVSQLGPASDDSSLTAPRLPAANGARILTSIEGGALAVTGLVRNGRLIQLVNAVDLAPYDKPATVMGVRALMVQLAKHADDSGLSGS